MANIKSAKKRVKVIKTKTLQNKSIKTSLKTVMKKAESALSTGADNTAEAIRLAMKKIDQAAAKGVVHKNKAANRKSALAKKLNQVKG